MFEIKVVDKIKTHILCLIKFFESQAVRETMSKIMVEPARPQMAILGARCTLA
jgi:hypothetical protein